MLNLYSLKHAASQKQANNYQMKVQGIKLSLFVTLMQNWHLAAKYLEHGIRS